MIDVFCFFEKYVISITDVQSPPLSSLPHNSENSSKNLFGLVAVKEEEDSMIMKCS